MLGMAWCYSKGSKKILHVVKGECKKEVKKSCQEAGISGGFQ